MRWLVFRDVKTDSPALAEFCSICKQNNQPVRVIHGTHARGREHIIWEVNWSTADGQGAEAIIYWPAASDYPGDPPTKVVPTDPHEAMSEEVGFEAILRGLLFLIRAGVSQNTVAGQRVKFILISSTLGAYGIPGHGQRSACLHACEGLVESASTELDDLGHWAFTLDIGLLGPSSDPHIVRQTAERIFEAVSSTGDRLEDLNAQSRTVVGNGDAIGIIQNQLRSLTEEIEDWKFLTVQED